MKIDNRIVFGVIGAAAVAIFFWGKSCERKEWKGKATKVDTQWLKSDTVHFYDIIPEPVEVIKYKKNVIIDTVTKKMVIVEHVDTSKIVEEFLSTYLYEDKRRLKYGELTISDTISRNLILGRGVEFIADSIPVVTKNVLIQQLKKPIVSLKGALIFNDRFLPKGGGGGFMYTAPNDKTYSLETKYLIKSGLYFEYEQTFPIRLKKKK